MIYFLALLLLVNVAFALRSLEIVRRSNSRLDAVELDGAFPMLSIVVPARNEERQIEGCVRSLLAQHHPDFEVIVVDDRSEDATRAILDRIAGEDARLRVVSGDELPDEWVGKTWALAQGLRAARGQWLLTTDADTEHQALAAGSALVYALRNKLDALSLITDQVVISPAERLFLPSIIWTIAFGTGGLDDVADPRRPAAIFNGQFVLMPRSTYEAIGGYACVKGEIAEDLELARLLKRERFNIALVNANGLVRTRMYRTFAEIWSGFVKNFALGVRGQPLMTALAVVFFALLSPIAPLAFVGFALGGHPVPALLLAAGMLAAMGSAEYGMRRMRFPDGSGWTLPLGMAVMLAIFGTSLVRLRTGRGVEWRGRKYRQGGPGARGF